MRQDQIVGPIRALVEQRLEDVELLIAFEPGVEPPSDELLGVPVVWVEYTVPWPRRRMFVISGY
jgi:hypothetical protein